MIVEDIPVPLVDDDRFRAFDELIHDEGDTVVQATAIGRFFSGEKTTFQTGITRWIGYGHMGIGSLFVIQQVLSVEPHDRADLDYRATTDQPDLDKDGCTGYSDLIRGQQGREVIELQRQAETGDGSWAFEDARRVAADALARSLKVELGSVGELRQSHQVKGGVVYNWRPQTGKVAYMVVVSRPYWLSFYARDPHRVAWIAVAVYESSCR